MAGKKENAKMAKTYIIKVKTDYSVEKVEFDEADSLAQLQDAVGGLIERVPIELQHGLDIFVNEEGALIPLKCNAILSMIYAAGVEQAVFLFGNGVFAAHDSEGNTLGIDEELADRLVALLTDIGEAFVQAKAEREAKV